jgi:hypothetical protein
MPWQGVYEPALDLQWLDERFEVSELSDFDPLVFGVFTQENDGINID